jgi:two-component system sensor histidine kinase FlrB
LSRRSLRHENGEILLLADVTESRQISELRQRKERLTLIGEMTAEFAHQVRTPLASAMLYASQLESTTNIAPRVAAKIIERLNDLGRMVNDMLGFAAGSKRSVAAVNTQQLLESVRSNVEAQLRPDTRLELLIDGSESDRAEHEHDEFTFTANGDSLTGALTNLIVNAEQAASGPTQIQLGAWRDKQHACFTVTDDGPGISEDVLPRLFEPFFTTRPQGTGLGLAVVRAVARAHDGDVSVESLTQGTRFTIRLPIASPDILNSSSGEPHD